MVAQRGPPSDIRLWMFHLVFWRRGEDMLDEPVRSHGRAFFILHALRRRGE